MPNTKTLSRSFSGGELSPEMHGRIDDAKYQSGAAKLLNFIATPQGPAENRPGFAYVNTTRGNAVARLIPFTFNVNQTMAIEMGEGYMRFHTLGATLKRSPSQRAFILPTAAANNLSFTVASPCTVRWDGHGFQDGDKVAFIPGALP